MFVGRERERARIDRLLEEARGGRSAALLLHGEAGIGKTALMRWAIGQATGLRVLRARGIETESDIAFAGLAELVTPLLDRLDDVPEVQARALRGALALGPATPHDRFTVPAGLLSLLAVAAEEQPVLVAIDDVQWLDEPSLEAFLFAGRRLGAEGIVILGALREGTAVAAMEVPWLEGLRIEPLADDESRELLGASQVERLAPSVTDRLVETAAGNPLALLEIPRQLSDGQRAGREPLEELLRPGTGVERAFRRELDGLGDAARRGLLVAATAHTGRIDVIEAALRRDRPRDRLPRRRRGGAPDHDRRRRAGVPPPAAALDRLPRGQRRRAPRRTRRARRRRAGRQPGARVAPGRVRGRARRGGRCGARGGGARRPRPRRARHGGARLRPRRTAHPGRRAARAAAARGGDRRDPLGRGRPRVRRCSARRRGSRPTRCWPPTCSA